MTLRRRLTLAAALAASTALAGWPLGATAQQAPPGPRGEAPAAERAVITADELTHDRALDTVTARGGVEIQYAGRILLADTVSYQVGRDYATASGEVTLVEPDGTTIFADYVELEDELKEGLVKEIRVLLKDGSRLAGRQAVRKDGRTALSYGVYSACDRCPDGGRAWEVKAVRVIHDQASRDIIYRDARLELFGVPVAYTPYLSHPDPTVERRSGFLAPTYGGTRNLGATITVPYYYVLSPSHDVTFSPMITTDEGLVLAGQHRLATTKGRIVSEGSITQDNSGRIRNHFSSEARFDLDETWRMGADVAVASDDTYLRSYGYASPAFLTTRPYVEGFSRRSYAYLEGYYFQDQVGADRTDGAPPVVMPLAGWDYVSAPGRLGGWHTAQMSSAIIERGAEGADSRRLSASYGWHLPYVGPIGDVYRLDLSVQGDAYHVNNVPKPGGGGADLDGATGRVVPEAALTWSLPLERPHDTFHEVFEPIVMGVVSPRGQNRERVPNEDSLDFEFDETNLFRSDRFPGHDRIEGGPRVNYGMKYAAYGGTLGRFTVTVGQSWHAFPDGGFSATSGMDEALSDYIGRVTIRPNENLDLLYRFRLDKDNLKAQRNNLALAVGPPILRMTGNYLSLAGSPLESGGVQATETLQMAVSSAFSRYWTIGAQTRYDLNASSGPIEVGGSVDYEDECMAVALTGVREYTYDRDYEGGFRVALRVVLKTLGEVQTSAGQ